MIIKVTEKHIKKGKMSSSVKCPIALALKEKFPNKRIYVSHHIEIGSKRLLKDYYYDSKVRKFIVDFDNNRSVTPFEFEL